MDARRALKVLGGGLVLLVSGCAWDQYPPPAARQEQPESIQPQEPPQVVDTDPPGEGQGEAQVQKTVLDYISRVDDARQRVLERGTQDPRYGDDPRYAADEGPASSTQPARYAPFEVLPEASGDAPPAGSQPTSSQPGGSTAAEADSPAASSAALDPPRLGPVTVHADAGYGTAMPGTPPAPSGPGVNEPAFARRGPTSLREFLEYSPPADDESFRAQLDRRMLWVIAGDYEQARAPLELVSAEQQELATRFVEAWIAIRDWHLGDETRSVAAATRELDELQQALRRLSDLSVPVVKMCSAVRGFGQYDEIDPPRLVAGAGGEFVLYCEVRDFVSELGEDGQYTTTFAMTTAILNRVGDTVLEIKDTGIVDRCRNRRQDCFIPRLVRLPVSVSAGRYVAKVSIVDTLGQKVAENRVPFELVARR